MFYTYGTQHLIEQELREARGMDQTGTFPNPDMYKFSFVQKLFAWLAGLATRSGRRVTPQQQVNPHPNPREIPHPQSR